jgi:hypothetical protein
MKHEYACPTSTLHLARELNTHTHTHTHTFPPARPSARPAPSLPSLPISPTQHLRTTPASSPLPRPAPSTHGPDDSVGCMRSLFLSYRCDISTSRLFVAFDNMSTSQLHGISKRSESDTTLGGLKTEDAATSPRQSAKDRWVSVLSSKRAARLVARVFDPSTLENGGRGARVHVCL